MFLTSADSYTAMPSSHGEQSHQVDHEVAHGSQDGAGRSASGLAGTDGAIDTTATKSTSRGACRKGGAEIDRISRIRRACGVFSKHQRVARIRRIFSGSKGATRAKSSKGTSNHKPGREHASDIDVPLLSLHAGNSGVEGAQYEGCGRNLQAVRVGAVADAGHSFGEMVRASDVAGGAAVEAGSPLATSNVAQRFRVAGKRSMIPDELQKKPQESWCTFYQRLHRSTGKTKAELLAEWKDMDGDARADFAKLNELPPLPPPACDPPADESSPGESSLNELPPLPPPGCDAPADAAPMTPEKRGVAKKVDGECSHQDCGEEAWACCVTCFVPLCGLHVGIFHKGNSLNPLYHRESRCHEHSTGFAKFNCPCQQCTSTPEKRTIKDAEEVVEEVKGNKLAARDGWMDHVAARLRELQMDDRCPWPADKIDVAKFGEKDCLKDILREHRKRKVQDTGSSFQLYWRMALLYEKGAADDGEKSSIRQFVQALPACLHVSRRKFGQVLTLLRHHVAISPGQLAEITIPEEFQMGRYGLGRMTPSQCGDMVAHITNHQKTNAPLSKATCERHICAFRLFSEGVDAHTAAKLSAMEEYRALCLTASSFKHFRQRVNAYLPVSQQINIRKKLKGLPAHEAKACNPAIVRRQLDDLLRICKELGIADSDGILQDGSLVWCCDEKGVDERKLNHNPGVVAGRSTKSGSGRQSVFTTAIANGGFGHVSVLSCISLDGKMTTPTACVSGKLMHKDYQDLWDGQVLVSPKGSFTCARFRMALEHWFKQLNDHQKASWKLLVCDSGGGSFMHFSEAAMAQWLVDNKVRMYCLGAYCTAALCPLDQDVHAHVNKCWQSFRQKHPTVRLTKRSVLFTVSEIYKNITEKTITDSWKHIGFVQGRQIDPDVVMVDRAADIFRVWSQEVPLKEKVCSESQAILKHEVSLRRNIRCASAPKCTNLLTAGEQHCSCCGQHNDKFDAVAQMAYGQHEKKGWRKVQANPAPIEVDPDLREAHRDLLQCLLKRKSSNSKDVTKKIEGEEVVEAKEDKVVMADDCEKDKKKARLSENASSVPERSWVAKDSSLHIKFLVAFACLFLYTLQDFGQGHPKGGNQTHHKNRMDVLDKILAKHIALHGLMACNV